jgi:hypothetical protein
MTRVVTPKRWAASAGRRTSVSVTARPLHRSRRSERRPPRHRVGSLRTARRAVRTPLSSRRNAHACRAHSARSGTSMQWLVRAQIDVCSTAVLDATRYGAARPNKGISVDEPNEASPARTPQPRWIGFVIIVAAVVVSLTVWPTVRRGVKRYMGA